MPVPYLHVAGLVDDQHRLVVVQVLHHIGAYVVIGDNVIYTLGVTNAGPNDAMGVQLIDILPLHFNFLSAEASQGTVTFEQGLLTAKLGDLAAGMNATVLSRTLKRSS